MKEKYMLEALKQAKKAFKNKETPIGAVIVCNNKIIAKSYNKKNKTNKVIDHAEIIAITKANKKLKNWRLNDCEIYVTLEPCPMCASAIKQSRIKKVYYGAKNSDLNNAKIIEKIFKTIDINSNLECEGGILERECSEMMTKFFKNKRNNE